MRLKNKLVKLILSIKKNFNIVTNSFSKTFTEDGIKKCTKFEVTLFLSHEAL